MNGGGFAWYKIASHLRLPVSVCKSIMPSTEFREWLHYLNYIDENEHSKIEWLLAQLCYYVSTDTKLKKGIKIESFFPKKQKQMNSATEKAERKKQIQAGLYNFVAVAESFKHGSVKTIVSK